MKRRLLALITAQCVLCALALAPPAGVAQNLTFTTPGMSIPIPILPPPTAGITSLGPLMLRNSSQGRQLEAQQRQQRCQADPSQCVGTNRQVQVSSRGARALLDTGNAFATTKGIDQLVAYYPAQDQPQIAQVFKTLIINFNKTIPSTYGIPANNLATAFAAIVAGSYAAYTNQPFPDNAVKPLFQQVEQVILNDPKMLQDSMEEKTATYQRWVGMGMFLMGWQAELAKNPDPRQLAKMQKAGADALHVLGFDPDRLHFTEHGMQLR